MTRKSPIILALFLLLLFATAPVPGQQSEPQYAPDRAVDILHVTIDVTPDFTARTISGETSIRFVPIAEPLTNLRLDAVDLRVETVTSSAAIEGYTVDDTSITLTFDPPVMPGTETTATIAYSAEPKLGLYFRTPEMGYLPEDSHLWTQGESHEAPYWFPNYDYPNERSTSEVICHVPKDMVVISNGRLVSEEVDPKTGLKAVRWLQDKPHANYLIALAAGKFKGVTDRYRNIPLGFYTPASEIDLAGRSFEGTADMMGFLESETGVPYPWDKYDQVVIDDFHWGGMENTTMTILNDRTLFLPETENLRSSSGLVCHELVHQWFGDYLTCKDWSHAWLNEGFATYFNHLYNGYSQGRDEMLYGLYNDSKGIRAERAVYLPIVWRGYSTAKEQFDYRTYPKGSWVLHMLHVQLGDDLFKQCITTYTERFALKSVVTDDLRHVFEEITGKTFDRFFDQWVYHARHPDLTVTYSWLEQEKLAKVTVEQTQTVDDNVMLFHFPTKVRFVVEGNTIDKDIVIDSRRHDFYFPLPGKPSIVRFDPESGVLATVTFDLPAEMLYAQLEDMTDIVGRLIAVEALGKKDDHETVARLKKALESDPFYGVRTAAAGALAEIHSKEAFDAIGGSLDQKDARVRLAGVSALGRFYRPESLALLKTVIAKEKNPDIVYEAVKNLGRYQDKDARELVLRNLRSHSFRNRLSEGAVEAVRMLADPSFAKPLMEKLKGDEGGFTSQVFGKALDTLAYITSTEDDRSTVRVFLAGYVNHPKKLIRDKAIEALGTLGDPAAIPIVETFSGSDPDDTTQKAAKDALAKLRQEKKAVPEEINALREMVDDLKKEQEKLSDEVKDIKAKLEAGGKKGE